MSSVALEELSKVRKSNPDGHSDVIVMDILCQLGLGLQIYDRKPALHTGGVEFEQRGHLQGTVQNTIVRNIVNLV